MLYQGAFGKYVLEKELAAGGEGAVWTIRGNSKAVAKVYHAEKLAADPKLEGKIAYMVSNPPADSVMDQIAWPRDILIDGRGRFAGFIMPKLDTDTDLKKIYPYPPKKEMPITTEQKLIIAINICIVISEVHKAGYIFGDFNPMNIGVNLKNGHVAFFDADSYHFTDPKNNETYRCGVGADGYIAPELIQKCHAYGKAGFLGTPLPTFTKETDEFALAIHIFKLLMNGYTPFNGIKETESASQSSPGTGNLAIERDNYCFKAGNKPMSPATPELSSLTPDVQYLFKRTFVDGAKDPAKRASAEEWKDALIEYKKSLVQCRKDPRHYYYINNAHCPYCAADERYKKNLMGIVSSYSTGSSGSAISQMSFSTPVAVPAPTAKPVGAAKTSAPAARAAASGNTAASGQGSSGITVHMAHVQTGGAKAAGSSGGGKKKMPLWVLILGILCFPILIAYHLENKKKAGAYQGRMWEYRLKMAACYILILPFGVFYEMFINDPGIVFDHLPHRSKTSAPAAAVAEATVETVDPFGTEILNLKEYGYFESDKVDDDIPSGFAGSGNWKNALRFRVGNGGPTASASYHLEGKFDRLTFTAIPFQESFSNDSTAEIKLVDLETDEIFDSMTLRSDDLPIDFEADISGINDLQILITGYGGWFAYTVLDNILAYPGDGTAYTSEDNVRISVESANIRSGAGKDYDVVKTASQGESYAVTGNKEADAENGSLWYEIYLDPEKSQTGWISEKVAASSKASGKASSKDRYGENALNLKNASTYDEDSIDGNVPNTFTAGGKLWNNALKFRAGNGSATAYAVYKLDGKYSKLSFQLLPYDYDIGFSNGAAAQIRIIDFRNDKVLFETKVEKDSEIRDFTVDISGVEYLRIEDTATGGWFTYCLFSDMYAYN